MPARAGSAAWRACRAMARCTGKTQDNSGWNRWKLSHLLGLPNACEVKEGGVGTGSAQGGRPGCPPAPTHGGGQGLLVSRRPVTVPGAPSSGGGQSSIHRTGGMRERGVQDMGRRASRALGLWLTKAPPAEKRGDSRKTEGQRLLGLHKVLSGRSQGICQRGVPPC